ncbi:hypothetical protein C2G38_2158233 [Gigaspora rosea]|uniref:Uncharacterized protein n=1 Tax=Gigaspora rosea TaxID=44941 RepID=A0A397W0R2_9GLOM|nr:hypothetical protein C2G38_2158233 [Gigaspora rosea]
MRGYNGGAVAKFNQLAKSNCTRIPCGLHVLHLILNNFEETAFNKYQYPLRSRWQYEAKQYLERREIHIEFVMWFLPNLKTLKKAPKSYIEKWEILEKWLNDFELNIKIQSLQSADVIDDSEIELLVQKLEQGIQKGLEFT